MKTVWGIISSFLLLMMYYSFVNGDKQVSNLVIYAQNGQIPDYLLRDSSHQVYPLVTDGGKRVPVYVANPVSTTIGKGQDWIGQESGYTMTGSKSSSIKHDSVQPVDSNQRVNIPSRQHVRNMTPLVYVGHGTTRLNVPAKKQQPNGDPTTSVVVPDDIIISSAPVDVRARQKPKPGPQTVRVLRANGKFSVIQPDPEFSVVQKRVLSSQSFQIGPAQQERPVQEFNYNPQQDGPPLGTVPNVNGQQRTFEIRNIRINPVQDTGVPVNFQNTPVDELRNYAVQQAQRGIQDIQTDGEQPSIIPVRNYNSNRDRHVAIPVQNFRDRTVQQFELPTRNSDEDSLQERVVSIQDTDSPVEDGVAVPIANYHNIPQQYQPYGFGYSVEDGAGTITHRQETADDTGAVSGTYGYKEQTGIFRIVNYVADQDGFRAEVQSNEPGIETSNPANVNIIAESPPFTPNVAPDDYLYDLNSNEQDNWK